jgi:hypothetical protein
MGMALLLSPLSRIRFLGAQIRILSPQLLCHLQLWNHYGALPASWARNPFIRNGCKRNRNQKCRCGQKHLPVRKLHDPFRFHGTRSRHRSNQVNRTIHGSRIDRIDSNPFYRSHRDHRTTYQSYRFKRYGNPFNRYYTQSQFGYRYPFGLLGWKRHGNPLYKFVAQSQFRYGYPFELLGWQRHGNPLYKFNADSQFRYGKPFELIRRQRHSNPLYKFNADSQFRYGQPFRLFLKQFLRLGNQKS